MNKAPSSHTHGQFTAVRVAVPFLPGAQVDLGRRLALGLQAPQAQREQGLGQVRGLAQAQGRETCHWWSGCRSWDTRPEGPLGLLGQCAREVLLS